MRYQFLLAAMLVAALYTMTACNKSTNPRLQTPPEEFKPITLEAGETKAVAQPKVNILFVVDNSGSMKVHQQTLKANIDQFANKFFDNARIDYKIGVVPVFDRKYLNDTYDYPGAGVRKMNPFGELVQLKGKDGQLMEGPRYITRETPDAKAVLKNTVAIGVQWGPEAEESFSPVVEVVSNPDKNEGFYDKDAYLVVIFLTDADDVTPEMTASSFYQYLVDAKGGDRSKVLIAAAIPNIKQHSASCALDGNGPQYEFPELIRVSGALEANLCSNSFGADLARFGDRLVQRVATQYIKVGFIPDASSFKVTYGTKDQSEGNRQVVPRGLNGFTWNPKTKMITLQPNMAVKHVDGGEVFVSATPVNMNNLRNGRTTWTQTPNAAGASAPAAKAKKTK